MKLSWTIALQSGPAVGSAEAATLDECTQSLEAALREAVPAWTPDHAAAFAKVRHSLATGSHHITAPSFLVTLED